MMTQSQSLTKIPSLLLQLLKLNNSKQAHISTLLELSSMQGAKDRCQEQIIRLLLEGMWSLLMTHSLLALLVSGAMKQLI